jgi:uncharacterized protein YebE (UPF0316 family)
MNFIKYNFSIQKYTISVNRVASKEFFIGFLCCSLALSNCDKIEILIAFIRFTSECGIIIASTVTLKLY